MSFDPEVWGTVSDWVIASTAVLAVWFGREQLKRVVEESARQADVARADLMLQIDQIFEGAEIGKSRMAIRILQNECDMTATSEAHDSEDDVVIGTSATLFSTRVTELYNCYRSPEPPKNKKIEAAHVTAGKEYTTLMALPYWMETVGMLARKKLLRQEDVLDLYDAVFVSVLTCFDQHIEYRRNERLNMDNRFLEHATWFRDQAKKRFALQARQRQVRLPAKGV